MGYKEHTADFIKAVRGGRGELDRWLELNNEAECRAAILGALEEAAELERKRLADWIELQRNDIPATGAEFSAAIRAL